MDKLKKSVLYLGITVVKKKKLNLFRILNIIQFNIVTRQQTGFRTSHNTMHFKN